VDAYRRLRNTLRFVLGNLDGWDEAERLAPADMPELERWVLHRLAVLDALVREASDNFDFNRLFAALNHFCAVELSAFYLDIRKDALYCDGARSLPRRAARTVLDQVFDCLTAWLAPVLTFTAEEAWLSRHPGEEESVHLRLFPDVPADWRDDRLDARWQKVRAFRRVVTGALEVERREKRIGASLQAAPDVYVSEDYLEPLKGLDLDNICITSGLDVIVGEGPADAFRLEDVAGVAVVPAKAEGEKCQRCWKVKADVGSDERYEDLCSRCADVVSKSEEAAA
jgi:isoleucyl-tRNA synthetase